MSRVLCGFERLVGATAVDGGNNELEIKTLKVKTAELGVKHAVSVSCPPMRILRSLRPMQLAWSRSLS
eukprot:3271487-Amphidinium_carterae.2